MATEIKKYDYIDALRGIAVLGTLMVHCSVQGRHDFPEVIEKFTTAGKSGVQLFFVMSALTLFLSMNKRKSEEKRPTLNFFIRRFFRIAPLFYVASVFALLEPTVAGREWLTELSTWPYILANFTFINSFNPQWLVYTIVEGGWSVAIEMLFYVLLPFIFLWVKSLRQALYFLAMSILLMILFTYFAEGLRFTNDESIWQTYLYDAFPAQLPIFALGIVLYFIITTTKEAIILSELTLPLLCLGAILVAHGIYNLLPGHFIISIGFVLLALGLSYNALRIFVNPVTMFIGKISFSMYLVHYPMIHLMHKLGLIDIIDKQLINFGLRYIILVVLATIGSYITYKLIEVPGQNLGKALIQRLEA